MQSSGGRVFKGALRGGRATRSDALSGATASELDTGAVLAAIDSDQVKDMRDLCSVMNVTPSAMEPLLDEFLQKGFLRQGKESLALSEIGQRALTYSRMAKF